MAGFFKSYEVESQDPTTPLVPRCGSCKLHRGCESPKMPATGKGRRRVLMVAEAPGSTEDEENEQMIGRSGQYLRKRLRNIGVDLDNDCWKTNALICYPKHAKPTEAQIAACRPNLNRTISELNPDVIVLMGGVSVKSLIGQLFREDVGPIGTWVGWQIPCQELNAWICPVWHPSYLGRSERTQEAGVLELWFDKHLEAAFELSGKPWPEGPPNWPGEVGRMYEPDEAADVIECMVSEEPIAFDFETDRLKPDHRDSRIVSCAISDGKNSFAYPWVGEAIQATSKLLKSKTPKIGANIKFEERWSRAVLGHGVRNWYWDTMQAAHVLDQRPEITSVQFQAFALLGQSEYGSKVRSYFHSDGSNSPNRISEANLDDLLLYNGMDALLEYKIAMKQMEMLNGSQ